MNKKILIDLIGIDLIALVVVVGYKLSPMLLPKADVTVFPDPACNLQKQACAVTLPSGGQVELSMGGRPVPLVKPFEVQVTTRGFSPKRVEIDFTGIDMNMGYNRPELAKRSEGSYSGEATLPVCITGRMTWQAAVIVTTDKIQAVAPFQFTTAKN